jgi:hypothetical protein
MDLNARGRYHMHRDLLMRVELVPFSLEISSLFMLLACCQLVAHPVGSCPLLGISSRIIKSGQKIDESIVELMSL